MSESFKSKPPPVPPAPPPPQVESTPPRGLTVLWACYLACQAVLMALNTCADALRQVRATKVDNVS